MKVKLIKGLSYTSFGVKVTNLNPVYETADTELAGKLIASKHFVNITEPGAVTPPANTGGEETPVDKMTEKQLEAYAAENGIDLTGLTKKADKLAKIQQASAESVGELDFGEGE